MCRQQQKLKETDRLCIVFHFYLCFSPIYISIFFYIIKHKQEALELGQIIYLNLSTEILRDKIAGVFHNAAVCKF